MLEGTPLKSAEPDVHSAGGASLVSTLPSHRASAGSQGLIIGAWGEGDSPGETASLG